MNSQRINLFLITKWFHPILAGGAERFRRYAPGLKERGIDLEVFTVLPPDYPNLRKFETIDGIRINRIPLSNVNSDYQILTNNALKHLEKTNRKPDLIQFFSVSPRTTYDILRMRLYSSGVIYVSTMVSNITQKSRMDIIKSWVYIRISMLGISRIIASSNVMKTSLISNGLGSKRIEVIPNGIDTLRFKPAISFAERQFTRNKIGLRENDQVILFVGSIIPRKGIDLLIDAWSKIVNNNPRAILILVGAYGEQAATLFPESQSLVLNYFDKISNTVENLPNKDRIIFTGEVANVEEYMCAADLFVFPSRQEGLPNVVLEAMSTGLPCILTPFVGLPKNEFGQPDSEYILLDGFDPNELGFKVNKLLKDKTMMNAIGQSARHWVEKNMDIELILDQYAAMYRSIATNKSNPL